VEPGIKFCATCGAPLADLAAARRGLSGPSRAGAAIALVLLDDLGNPVQRFERNAPDTTIGRQDGDIRFPEDVFLSPLHAKLSWSRTPSSCAIWAAVTARGCSSRRRIACSMATCC